MSNSKFHVSASVGLAVMLLSSAANADDLYAERVWTSKNGQSLRGTCLRTLNNNTQVEIQTTSNKIVVIAAANLSDADRQLVSGETPDPLATATEKPGELAAFKDLPTPDRTKLPVISQSDFGNKASDCVPSSFCNFLLWWDQTGVLEIPKRGDFNAKAEWIHSRMARYCGTRNTAGTGADDAVLGFKEYFTKELGELATPKIGIDYDLRPENLARYTTGCNATMLSVTLREAPRHDSGHWVALASASADGQVVFHTWGARFEGKIEVLEKNPEILRLETHQVPATSYEIIIRNRGDLPDWFRNSDMRIILDPAQWDSICIAKPYLYKEKGKRSPAPADPLLDPVIR